MKKMLLFCLLAGLAAETFSQGSWVVPSMVSKNAIVRTVDDTHVLIYNEESAGTGYFLLYENGMPMLSFQLPAGFMVHDVEVYDKTTAYFCGEVGGTGLVGFFDVMSVFYGSASVSYLMMPGLIPANPEECYNCDMDVKKFSRLAVAKVGGIVEMALIAEGIITYTDGPAYRSTVVSAVHLGGMWHYYIGYNKRGRVDFTDIAYTDDYVVAVGTDSLGEGCYVKTYRKAVPFPYNVVMSPVDDEVVAMNPRGEAFVVATRGNEVAVVQYDEKPGVLVHYLEFNTVPGRPAVMAPSLLTAASPIPYIAGAWEMNEVRYSAANSMLYVLGWMNHPSESGFDSWLLSIPDAASGTINATKYLSGKQYSIDVNPLLHPVSAGVSSMVSGSLSLRPELPVGHETGDCMGARPLGIAMPSVGIEENWVDDEHFRSMQMGASFKPEVKKIEVVPECEK